MNTLHMNQQQTHNMVCHPQLSLVDNNMTAKQQLCDEMVDHGCMQAGADITENESGFWRFPDSEDSHGKTAGWCSPFYSDDGQLLAATYGTHRDEGNSHHWKSSGFTNISDEERADVERKIQAQRVERESERAQTQIHSRQILSNKLSKCLPATQHPYLSSKGIQGHGVLQGANEELYLPLSDIDGNLVTVQRIKPDGSKLLWSGCGKSGGMLKIVGDSQVILIAEGYATAASLYEATGYTCIMAIDAGNLVHVAKAVQTKYNKSAIVICGDNDQFKEKNTGEEKCKQIEQALGIPYVLPQFEDISSQPTDFNDLAQSEGNERVCEQIEPVVTKARLNIPRGFSVSSAGVFYDRPLKDGGTTQEWVCSPLLIPALTRDTNSESWGRLIELVDDDGVVHRFAMPKTMLTGQPTEYLKPLVERGLTYNHEYRNQLHEYLSRAKPINRARCVSKTGWFNGCFVLPKDVIGESDEKMIFQSTASLPKGFETSGTLEEWQNHVAALCSWNSRLAFGVCTAFATALLPMLDGESGGFHFRCGSSRGKTTILMAGKSVWGTPDGLPRWRATANGLEGIAALHNHSLLCLDEFSQLAEVSPKSAGEAIYMLGNGEGKQRSLRDGSMAKRQTWQLLYLSAGEVSLKATMEQAGLAVRAGQEVRFIDLPAEAGQGLGVFDTVHDFGDGNRFAMAIKENSLKYYGTAARDFIAKVAASYGEHQEWMIENVDRFTQSLDLGEADPQVYRVAQRFAIIAAAGELATKLGTTGWDDGMATWCAKVCFDAWVDQRGGTESHEEVQAIETVKGRLLENATARFASSFNTPSGAIWGYVFANGDYFVQSAAFKNYLCAGLDPKYVAQLLVDQGFLIASERSDLSRTHRCGGHSKRGYRILSEFLNDSESDDAESVTHENEEETIEVDDNAPPVSGWINPNIVHHSQYSV